ncbi:MAG: hypothetical protein J7M18_05805 [Candidatus Eremiobacteraeota bacterium]|nr:hypothetical protein [Candidatus Eremiobacteraeota bacterium]
MRNGFSIAYRRIGTSEISVKKVARLEGDKQKSSVIDKVIKGIKSEEFQFAVGRGIITGSTGVVIGALPGTVLPAATVLTGAVIGGVVGVVPGAFLLYGLINP